MNPAHAHFAEWDAAYVLGALSASDRRLFEDHLAECDTCPRAIAEVAPTIGLLGRVDRERAESLVATEAVVPGPDPALRAEISGIVARESARRRRMWWTGGLDAAAALVVAIVIAVTIAVVPAVQNVTVVAMDATSDIPITASVELTGVAWGTRIELVCTYGATEDDPGEGDGDAQGRPYVLTVTAQDGSVTEVSSWRALPGTTAHLSAGTALDPVDIASVEIRSVDSDRVLMRAELAPSTE